MTTNVRALWLRLQAILAEYSDKFSAADPSLILDIGCTENDVFLLRAYLAVKKHADGDELAITVDIQSDDHNFTIKSDACADDGRVFATGPFASIPLSEELLNLETEFDSWIRKFERFLLENEKMLLNAASELSSTIAP